MTAKVTACSFLDDSNHGNGSQSWLQMSRRKHVTDFIEAPSLNLDRTAQSSSGLTEFCRSNNRIFDFISNPGRTVAVADVEFKRLRDLGIYA